MICAFNYTEFKYLYKTKIKIMNKLIVDTANSKVEWQILSNNWNREQLYYDSKIIENTYTYKITNVSESVTYTIIPIELTVVQYETISDTQGNAV